MEVTGLTAEAMIAIRDGVVVNGVVNGAGHLILTRYDGTFIDAGLVIDPAAWANDPAFTNKYAQAGLHKIAGVDLVATALAIDFAAIPATYDHLRLVAHLRSNVAASTFDNIVLQLNADVADANYFYESNQVANVTFTGSQNLGAAQSRQGMLINGSTAPANMFSELTIDIPNYRLAHTKQLEVRNNLTLALTTGNIFLKTTYYVWNSVAVINRIKLSLAGAGATSQFVIGSRATLYGIKV